MSLAVLRAAAEKALAHREALEQAVVDLPEAQAERLLGEPPAWAHYVRSLVEDLPADLAAETTTEQIRRTLVEPAAMRGVAVRILAVADLVEAGLTGAP